MQSRSVGRCYCREEPSRQPARYIADAGFIDVECESSAVVWIARLGHDVDIYLDTSGWSMQNVLVLMTSLRVIRQRSVKS